MADGGVPQNRVYLVASWLEVLFYGIFLCMWMTTIYLAHITRMEKHDSDSRIMTIVSTVMIVLATAHLGINLQRLIAGYADSTVGPLPFYHQLSSASHVAKVTVYATQEILGNAIAVYRTWILWNKDLRPVILPILMIFGSAVSGYGTCAIFTKLTSATSIFVVQLTAWVRAFYSIAVIQNLTTTGLMSYRIWKTHKRTATYQTTESPLIGVIRILVESAALQLVAEVVLLILYSINSTAQYLLLESITPLVGITFTAITIRIRLKAVERSMSSGNGQSSFHSRRRDTFAPAGSTPMQRIHVNINRDVEHDAQCPGPYGPNKYAEVDSIEAK